MGHYENSLETITSILEQHPEHIQALAACRT
jgi:hypothetical protein